MNGEGKHHTVIISERRAVTLTGIESIEGFDEQSILMKTSDDGLSIQGSGLHVDKFDAATGDMSVSGDIDAVLYYDYKRKPDKKNARKRGG